MTFKLSCYNLVRFLNSCEATEPKVLSQFHTGVRSGNFVLIKQSNSSIPLASIDERNGRMQLFLREPIEDNKNLFQELLKAHRMLMGYFHREISVAVRNASSDAIPLDLWSIIIEDDGLELGFGDPNTSRTTLYPFRFVWINREGKVSVTSPDETNGDSCLNI